MDKVVHTKELTYIYDTRLEVTKLADRIRILGAEKAALVASLKGREEALAVAIRLGAVVQSRKYIVALKDHIRQKAINWQKEFRRRYPKAYKDVQQDAGSTDYIELIIAERSSS